MNGMIVPCASVARYCRLTQEMPCNDLNYDISIYGGRKAARAPCPGGFAET